MSSRADVLGGKDSLGEHRQARLPFKRQFLPPRVRLLVSPDGRMSPGQILTIVDLLDRVAHIQIASGLWNSYG